MEYSERDERDGLVYDPVIKQYDTAFWKTTTGVPAMSSNVLRFTSAAAASYIQFIFSDVEFALNVPTTPSAGEAKVWGLRKPSSDKLGAAYFEITGATFQAVTYDDGGTAQTTAITWSSYENTVTYYRIVWEPDGVRFLVNGSTVAFHTTRVPQQALPLRIVNGDADNTDLTYLAVRRSASVI
jgi:hypothetical protein